MPGLGIRAWAEPGVLGSPPIPSSQTAPEGARNVGLSPLPITCSTQHTDGLGSEGLYRLPLPVKTQGGEPFFNSFYGYVKPVPIGTLNIW